MKKLLRLLPVILLFYSCDAQQAGERFTKTSVVIFNNTNNKTTILLGSTTKLDTFKLKENEVWFSPSFTFNPTFKLQTKNHTVAYQLRLDNYYMIFWNNKKKYWDLKKTKKRQ